MREILRKAIIKRFLIFVAPTKHDEYFPATVRVLLLSAVEVSLFISGFLVDPVHLLFFLVVIEFSSGHENAFFFFDLDPIEKGNIFQCLFYIAPYSQFLGSKIISLLKESISCIFKSSDCSRKRSFESFIYSENFEKRFCPPDSE